MTIPAGQTQVSQPIIINEDDEAEGRESFQAQLIIPSATAGLSVTLGVDDTATVTITDNDDVIVSFSPMKYTVTEGDGEVVPTLTANRPASFEYTVAMDTANGTAIGEHTHVSGQQLLGRGPVCKYLIHIVVCVLCVTMRCMTATCIPSQVILTSSQEATR